ncbi:hypothetical protein HYFRA_00010697 [Hymenoscyphus fraxineus]|uniref:Uncharacterized protein n=1 Tax=Hymenoscyphus fraxineus TaxID=746836 RepID=A0A9N9PKL8_9HELO|nr:hypothetical protein HYFRA_00010697 [Hymenoscyphus fraxineus]
MSHESLISRPVATNDPYDVAWVQGRTILITGGASGIGAGLFRKWAENGANIVIGDINDKLGEELVAEVRKTTGNQHLHYIHCDVTNWLSQVHFFKTAKQLSPTGGIDAVVANAGITDGNKIFDKNVHDYETLENPPAPVFKCMDVNLTGVMYTAKLAIYYLSKNPESDKASTLVTPEPNTRDRHLLLVGSIASLGSLPGLVQYNASKHAVLGLFRSLNTTSFLNGLRVNIILPYFTDTPILPVSARLLLAGGAMGTPEDVVEAATRLMADTRLVGRALAIGPRATVDKNGHLCEANVPGSRETSVWDIDALDFSATETFTRRFVGLLTQIERTRGWVGLVKDIFRVLLNPFRGLWQ